MMNLVILVVQIACFAFLVWGGILSAKCAIEAGDFEFTGQELKAA
jgi:hypothetical protein